MDNIDISILLFYVTPLLVIFIAYYLLILYRQKKYKGIARYFKAKYVSQGKFKIGKIIGIKDDKKIIIMPYTVKKRKSSSYYTLISTDCQNKLMPLIIFANFFLKSYPTLDFKYIYAFNPKKKKIGFDTFFYWNSDETVLDYKSPLDTSYHDKLKDVFSSMPSDFYSMFKAIRTDYIFIEEKAINHNSYGVITNIRKINKILYINNCISEKIENNSKY